MDIILAWKFPGLIPRLEFSGLRFLRVDSSEDGEVTVVAQAYIFHPDAKAHAGKKRALEVKVAANSNP